MEGRRACSCAVLFFVLCVSTLPDISLSVISSGVPGDVNVPDGSGSWIKDGALGDQCYPSQLTNVLLAVICSYYVNHYQERAR